MKKNLTVFTLLLVVSSIILPLLPVITVQAQAEPLIYKVKAYAPNGDWDNPIDPGWSLQSLWFKGVTAEDLTSTFITYSGGVNEPIEDEWAPELATSWTVNYWPSELNSKGFFNTGGIKDATFTLRENVTFHDGSIWNATAAKWNIDRYYIITGNLTGDGDLRNLDYYWPLVDDTAAYWTPSWNLSTFNNIFAGYYVGPNVDYPNVNEVGGYVNNSNPGPISAPYAPYDRYPLVKYVEILDNGTVNGGGQIKIHWNTWNTEGRKGTWMAYSSYHAYHLSYTGRGVYGYQNGVLEAGNPTIVDHLLGTGTYYYVTSGTAGGHVLKYDGYWNRTAIEAEGNYDIDRVNIINFPTTEAGALSANNALLSHDLDMAVDGSDMPLDTNAVKGNPNLKYYVGAPSDYPVDITLNSINETWWAWSNVEPWVMDGSYPNEQGEPYANGIPLILRRALTYAFDYDHLIDVGLEGKAVRSGGVVGVGGIYHDPTVNIPEFNKTYARELLLTTENDTSGKVYTAGGLLNGYNPSIELYNFTKRTADRGLTALSTDAQWRAVAEGGNPVWTLDFYWASWLDETKEEFEASAYLLGVALVDNPDNRLTGRIWDIVQTYWLTSFPSGSSIWSASAWPMPYYKPGGSPEIWVDFNYHDPDSGRWRDGNIWAGGIADYFPLWNFGFSYDTEIDDLLDKLFMSEPSLKKGIIADIADRAQNEIHPFIYTYQGVGGYAQWDCWETDLYLHPRLGILIGTDGFPGGVYNYANINYKGCPETAPLIPGFSVFVTLTVSLVSILSIAYVLMRRKKLR